MAEALLERGNPNRLGKGNTGFRATNTRVRLGALAAFALAALAMASPSWAVVTFTFDFNSLANGASSTAIRNYMRTVSGDNALTVTGAIASRTYNGDGHVVGPTLGPDTFIINNGPGSNQFLINFGGFFFISSISFDWEIFPDASCQAHSACAGHGQFGSELAGLRPVRQRGRSAGVPPTRARPGEREHLASGDRQQRCH